jgi:hypothetical protein
LHSATISPTQASSLLCVVGAFIATSIEVSSPNNGPLPDLACRTHKERIALRKLRFFLSAQRLPRRKFRLMLIKAFAKDKKIIRYNLTFILEHWS